MAKYTQDKRPMRVETVFGKDVLLLTGLSGSEAISAPFAYHLEMFSQNAELDPDKILRTAVTVTLLLGDGSERKIHGLVRRFVQLGQEQDATFYEAEIVPWFWFLCVSQDSRIFQQMTVLEIAEAVFRDQGFTDFELRCSRSYPKREYCVQYRESPLNFVSRLLEEEGIFYFFEHTASKHMLVLADANSAAKPCPGPSSGRVAPHPIPNEDVVTRVRREHAVHVGTITLRDYDHLQPSLKLESSAAGSEKQEHYDHPGKYTQLDEGDRYARLRLEVQEAQRHSVRGESTCRHFASGSTAEIKEHYRRDVNQKYLLVRVRHSAFGGDYRSWDEGNFDYRNEFEAIPNSVPFRPLPGTPKPVVRGSQTAVVVGKSGEEIWVDKYGRVKVQFHWDRKGKNDENSSCWVRVSSLWAGKQWGAIHIPRIGQEVIVDFLEGDPDRPIITGRVYNAEQMPPYGLPGQQMVSGVKSRSTKGGGGENFNEIRMDDKKGSELLYIHAEKDKQVVVEHDRTESVGNDETYDIGHDQQISIGNDRTESVGNNESITVGANRTESVGKDESITIGANRTVSVGKNESIDIGQNRSMTIGKNEDRSVGDNRTTQIGKDDTLRVGKKLLIDAGDEIVLRTGSASITMKKNGDITIKGKNITIQASGKITGKASGDVVLKGSKVLAN